MKYVVTGQVVFLKNHYHDRQARPTEDQHVVYLFSRGDHGTEMEGTMCQLRVVVRQYREEGRELAFLLLALI